MFHVDVFLHQCFPVLLMWSHSKMQSLHQPVGSSVQQLHARDGGRWVKNPTLGLTPPSQRGQLPAPTPFSGELAVAPPLAIRSGPMIGSILVKQGDGDRINPFQVGSTTSHSSLF